MQFLGKQRTGDGNDVVRNRGEDTFLLKQIQPVVSGSSNSAGRLTEKSLPRKLRLQERAGEVQEHIREAGGRNEVSLLERQIRCGLLGLLKVFRRNNITIRGFLKRYKERFTMRSGVVSVRNATDAPTPTPAPDPAPVPDPVPATPAFEALSMEEQKEIVDARTATRKAKRVAAGKERIKSVWKLYGKT